MSSVRSHAGRRNQSGARGVSRNGRGFAARFRGRSLGTFKTVAEASEAHERALAECVGVGANEAANYTPSGGMRLQFLVDEEYADLVAADAWHLTPRGYVQRGASTATGHKTILLHQYVWGLAGRSVPTGLSLDHINRDKTDCRLANLRLATRRMQSMNRGMRNSTGLPTGVRLDYEGVRGSRLFVASCCGQYLGCYATAEEAAAAHQAAYQKAWEQEEQKIRHILGVGENGPLFVRLGQ